MVEGADTLCPEEGFTGAHWSARMQGEDSQWQLGEGGRRKRDVHLNSC